MKSRKTKRTKKSTKESATCAATCDVRELVNGDVFFLKEGMIFHVRNKTWVLQKPHIQVTPSPAPKRR